MRIDFSEMNDHALVEELFELDRQAASLLILGVPDGVYEDAEHAIEDKMCQVEDKYGHDDAAIYSIRMSMPSMPMVLDAIRDKRGIYAD